MRLSFSNNAAASHSHSDNHSAVILVAEDDPISRRLIREVLNNAGHQVLLAANGDDAEASYRKHRPDLVLLDVVMPGRDGFSVVEAIRGQHADPITPIIMLTGMDDVDSINYAFEGGATDFITKPINWSLLSQRVRYALKARAMATELRLSRERLAEAQRIAGIGQWHMDLDTGSLVLTDSANQILCQAGHGSVADFSDFLSRLSATKQAEFQHALASCDQHPSWSIELCLKQPDSHDLHVQMHAQIQANVAGQRSHLFGTMQNITALRTAQEQARYVRSHDQVTGLPNQRWWLNALDERIRQATATTVISLEVRDFRAVVANFGQQHGNELLSAIAGRLQQLTAADAVLLSRLEGAQFALAVALEGNRKVATAWLSHLITKLSQPVTIDGENLHPCFNAGVTHYPENGQQAAELLRQAQVANEQIASNELATADARPCFYEPSVDSDSRRRLQLLNELRNAIGSPHIQLYYQPQIDARNRRLIGMEALIRWHHPVHGFVPPNDFIPQAEQSGLIVRIGQWALRTVAQQLALWRDAGLAPVPVGVNFTPTEVLHPDFCQQVAQVIEEYHLKSHWLDIEVTERIAMSGLRQVRERLQALKQVGVSLSMDDFGVGYSSMSYLQDLCFDILKIDRAFVAEIEGDTGGAIAKAVIAMAQSLDKHIIAEGVETQAQVQWLTEHGCQSLQGYYYSPPVPVAVVTQMLTQGLVLADEPTTIAPPVAEQHTDVQSAAPISNSSSNATSRSANS